MCSNADSGYYVVGANGLSADGEGSPVRGAVGQVQVNAGFVPVDINNTIVNTKAVRQWECPCGKYAATAGLTECTSVTSGYYAIDGNGDATDLAGVGQAQAQAGTSCRRRWGSC